MLAQLDPTRAFDLIQKGPVAFTAAFFATAFLFLLRSLLRGKDKHAQVLAELNASHAKLLAELDERCDAEIKKLNQEKLKMAIAHAQELSTLMHATEELEWSLMHATEQLEQKIRARGRRARKHAPILEPTKEATNDDPDRDPVRADGGTKP